MDGEILTTIISALVAAIAGPIGAWVGRKLERSKYQIELDRLRTEVKEHELENLRKASDILMESIVPPLQAEIENLRNDLQRLNNVLERIWGCPHIDRCPVKYELLLKPQGGGANAGRDNGGGRGYRPRRKPDRGKARDDPDRTDNPDGADDGGDGNGD